MPYLRTAWYAAGWSHDLGNEPVARTILEQPVVFYRGDDGRPVALYDACPHRFAPLSRGKVQGNRIACGYHGLEFDSAGRCVRNPHGKGAIPAALHVTAYPIAERYGMLWIWMGAPAGADQALIPSLPGLENPELSWVHGQLHVAANYELVIDNLLDLTHVEFLHPFLASPGNSERTSFRAEQKGDLVSAYYDIKGEPVSGLFQLLWEGGETQGDMRAYIHWRAPSNLYLDTGMSAPGGDPALGVQIPSVHLLTPETEDTTHYFWAAGRNRRHGDEQISGMLHYGTQNAFENEDEPMIRAVRSRMQSNDLFSHQPALLPIDEAAVRARRILRKLIDEEKNTEARLVA
jgi:phenylpropionate dioxygenase-like ring-hydroxylating dioxygenase large terminal subunit